jgi:hypothetical protein
VAIQHPNIFYFVLDSSWSLNSSLEYWNKGNTATSANNNAVSKTIYSPSPSYFVEPNTAAFTGFTSSGGNSSSGLNVNGSYNNGFNFFCYPNNQGSTIFIPGLGFRDVYSGRVNVSTSGSIFYTSTNGRYWTSGPSSASKQALSLDFVYNFVYTQGGNYIGDGMSLQPTHMITYQTYFLRDLVCKCKHPF